MDIVNGVPAPALGAVDWRKSARSNSQGNCVELGRLVDGRIGMRDSKHPSGPALVFAADEIASWLGDLKSGRHDHLLVVQG